MLNIKNMKKKIISAAFFAIVINMLACNLYAQTTSIAMNGIQRTGKAEIKVSLNAYSFNTIILPTAKDNTKPPFTLFNLLDFCAENNIPALDITGYYFPGYPEVPADEYIYSLKKRAFQLGIDISGTGIKNNFASPDPAVRAAGVELAKKWIVVASKLGAPVLRTFAGEIPKGYENKWDEVAGWMIECFKECAAYGEKYGVIIGIQNHGDMLQTAEQCIKVIKAVNSDWAGLIVDTGNFKTKDPYADIEAVVPYSVNWQVKESAFGLGNEIETDYARVIKILKKGGYRGYLPVETLVVKGKPYDPFKLVPDMINKLKVNL
jgi:sugar phosphate isomerase/epimerase